MFTDDVVLKTKNEKNLRIKIECFYTLSEEKFEKKVVKSKVMV